MLKKIEKCKFLKSFQIVQEKNCSKPTTNTHKTENFPQNVIQKVVKKS